MKLALENKLSSYSIGDGDFLVLVPFVKKDRQQTEQSATSPDITRFATSKQYESTWCDVVEDLSVLRSTISSKNQNNIELESVNFKNRQAQNVNVSSSGTSQRKRKLKSASNKTEQPTDELIFDILQSPSSSMDEQASKFIMVLDSVNCLIDPSSGNCICNEAHRQNTEMNLRSTKSNLCSCPSWLKSKMKLFSFVNIYSAVIQLQHGKITLCSLKQALDQLSKFGFQSSITDVEHLSDICPQVLVLLGYVGYFDNLVAIILLKWIYI